LGNDCSLNIFSVTSSTGCGSIGSVETLAAYSQILCGLQMIVAVIFHNVVFGVGLIKITTRRQRAVDEFERVYLGKDENVNTAMNNQTNGEGDTDTSIFTKSTLIPRSLRYFMRQINNTSDEANKQPNENHEINENNYDVPLLTSANHVANIKMNTEQNENNSRMANPLIGDSLLQDDNHVDEKQQ